MNKQQRQERAMELLESGIVSAWAREIAEQQAEGWEGHEVVIRLDSEDTDLIYRQRGWNAEDEENILKLNDVDYFEPEDDATEAEWIEYLTDLNIERINGILWDYANGTYTGR